MGTIDSKRKITHPSQKRPRSRTLKAVHKAILGDCVVPSQIVGRRARVSPNTGFTETVYLDPLDKFLVEEKIGAMAAAYQKLTTHKISIEFAKPTSFQKKKLEKLNERRLEWFRGFQRPRFLYKVGSLEDSSRFCL